jgi:hypothetical protein
MELYAAEAFDAGRRPADRMPADAYKPSTIRGYARSLKDHLLPEFGDRKLASITTADTAGRLPEVRGHSERLTGVVSSRSRG